MVEGIPAFSAVSRSRVGLIAIMLTRIRSIEEQRRTWVCALRLRTGLQHFSLGPVERYCEEVSGSIVAILSANFLFIHRADVSF
jgi:hypothetical protein